jgi:predicted neutral ceramidase superfamily lipid hydrolase
MAAASAIVFALSWWLGLYLLARDPRKPVLLFAAAGLTSFACVVALDAVRVVSGSDMLSSVEVFVVTMPGVAWLAVLLELARTDDTPRGRSAQIVAVATVALVALSGAATAGNVDGPLRSQRRVLG